MVGIVGLLLSLIASIAIFKLAKFLVWYMSFCRKLKGIPVPLGSRFLVGAKLPKSNVDFFRKVVEVCTNMRNKPIFVYWLGPIPIVVCNTPPAVEALLGSSEHIKKSTFYESIYQWLGDSLLLVTGDRWRTRRKLLTPAFHFSVLQNYISVFNEHSSQLVDVIKEKVESLNEKGKLPHVDMYPYMVSSTLDVICETAMGHNLNSLYNDHNVYGTSVRQLTDIVMQRMKNPLVYNDFIFSLTSNGRKHNRLLKTVRKFTSDILEKRRREMKELGLLDETTNFDKEADRKKWKLAFIDLLLHEQHLKGSISSSDIQAEIDTFMFEGHDTTAVAMSYCLYNVAANPRVQEKLHEELDDVFPNRTCDVTNEHIGKLKYLDMVIKESLRLYPSVPIFARTVTSEFEVDKYTVPVGASVLVVPIALHRNPKVFSDPMDFFPERFEDTKRHPYSYVPFSAGPRNCIGSKFATNEMKITLSWLFRNFSFTALQARDECTPAADIILKPGRGILLDIKIRD